MNTQEPINQLQQQVQELLKWKEEKMRQQIAKALDNISKNMTLENQPIPTFFDQGLSIFSPLDRAEVATLNGKVFFFPSGPF